eukprot:4198702-Prymnesium_polylepis.1
MLAMPCWRTLRDSRLQNRPRRRHPQGMCWPPLPAACNRRHRAPQLQGGCGHAATVTPRDRQFRTATSRGSASRTTRRGRASLGLLHAPCQSPLGWRAHAAARAKGLGGERLV